MNKTDRLFAIVLELQAKRWQRARDLAETLEVSTRTIYRDMDALCAAGVPVVSVPGKGYSLFEGYFLPPLTFTTDEAVLLLLGTGVVADRLGLNYQAAARAARTKIEAILPDRLHGEVATLQDSILFAPIKALYDQQEQHALQRLRRAITDRRCVRFHYHRPTSDDDATTIQTSERAVDPYGLVDLRGAWLLVGYCHLRKSVRRFRLSRMENLEVLAETFGRPDDFILQRDEALEQRHLVVRLHFDADATRSVLEAPSFYTSFYTAAVEERPDGLLLTLKVRQETDVMPWLLSWGVHVRVLEPASLRERLAREAEKMLMRHRAAPDS